MSFSEGKARSFSVKNVFVCDHFQQRTMAVKVEVDLAVATIKTQLYTNIRKNSKYASVLCLYNSTSPERPVSFCSMEACLHVSIHCSNIHNNPTSTIISS